MDRPQTDPDEKKMGSDETKMAPAEAEVDVEAETPLDHDHDVDPAEEKAVLRKFDRYVLPQAFLILLVNFLDRSNLGNAKVFGLEKSLGLHGNQFGNLVTLFFVPYVVAEVFWVAAVKRFGPNYVIAAALGGWCAVTLATGFVHTYAQALACRMLLGLFEAGVAPCFVFFFTTIYARASTSKRVALINLANAVSGAFGGLLAYAIQSMGARRGLEAWRWLFILEGSLSLALCAACLWTLPNRPETAWFLSAPERALMRRRRLRDAVHNGHPDAAVDRFAWKWVRRALTDPFVYAAAAAFFASSVAISGYGTFLPTLLRGFGYSSLQANYLTIPVYAAGALSLAAQAYWSDRLNRRAVFVLLSTLPVVAGYLVCVGTASRAAGYAAMFVLITGVYSVSCLLQTWVAVNLVPEHKRAIGLPLVASIGNCSGLVAGQLYPSRHGPRYVLGNAVSAGLEAVAALLVALAWLLLRRRNQRKDQLRAQGATTNGADGDAALDFRYVL